MRDSDEAVRPEAEALRAAQRHGTGLKAVSAQLSSLVASLRDSRRQLAERSHSAAIAPDGPRDAPEGDPSESANVATTSLTPDASLAHEATPHRDGENGRLQARLAEIEAENRRLADELGAVQEQTAELARRLVVLSGLHGTLDRGGVLAAIVDILVNIVGAEDLAVFERSSDRTRLVPAASFGARLDHLDEIPIGQGTVGRAAEAGTLLLNGRSGPSGEDGLAACVPLVVGEEVTGVIVIYRLLGHKRLLRAADQSILDLLGRHAAIALRCAGALEGGRAEAGR